MNADMKVAGIVITFNRKELLLKCLQSIEAQTRKPNVFLIVDHGSIDGTEMMVRSGGYDKIKNGVEFKYLLLKENKGRDGRAFYIGMDYLLKSEDNYDYIWMMDDDGYADKDELNNLLQGALKHNLDFANSMVVDRDDPQRLSCGIPLEIEQKKGDLTDLVNAYNGTLIKCSTMKEVGLIRREMVSWGIEVEYPERFIAKGYHVAGVCNAIHYHPKFRQKYTGIFPRLNIGPKFNLPLLESPNRIYQYKNSGYLERFYNHKSTFWKKVLYFAFRLKFIEMFTFIYYYLQGWNNNYKIEELY